MAGKREKKRNRLRLPAAVVLLAAAGGLLTGAAGVQGIVTSPVEEPVPMVDAAAMLPAAMEKAALPVVMPVPLEEEITPAALEPEVKEPFAPVAESGAVEDAYFETAAFLGDSRTQGFMLYSGLDYGTYYYAMGATVESVFTKAVPTPAGEMPLLDAMAEGEFERIYVMLGVNELGWKGTQLFFDHYGAVIDRLKADHPDAEIFLQSILPVGTKQEEKHNYVNNPRIREYNEVIFALAEQKDCCYLDVASAVTDENGRLRSDWTYDGVHLYIKGSQAWLDYLKTHTVS